MTSPARRERIPKLDTLLVLEMPGAVLDTDHDSHGQPVVERGPETTVRVWAGLIEREGAVVQPDGESEFIQDRTRWVVRFSPQWRVGSTFATWGRKWRVMQLKATDDRRYLTLDCEGI